jgi:hypothetical protein
MAAGTHPTTRITASSSGLGASPTTMQRRRAHRRWGLALRYDVEHNVDVHIGVQMQRDRIVTHGFDMPLG